MDKRGVWRVNYYASNGTPQTALVVAVDGAEAATFLGIQDSSGVQVVRDRYPVEVAGLDQAHDPIAPIPVVIPPLGPSKQFSDAEIRRIRELLNAPAVEQIPAADKVSGGPTPVQADPLPKE